MKSISISDGTFSAFPNYIDLSWDELSKQAKENHIKNVKNAVMLVLGTVAPSQEDAIWQSLLQSELSRRDPVRCTFDVGLEAILQAYKECENKSTKIQILSLIYVTNIVYRNFKYIYTKNVNRKENYR